MLDFVDAHAEGIHGEWMGFVRTTRAGSSILAAALRGLASEPERLNAMKMPDLLRLLIDQGHRVGVVYTTGHWLDIDTLDDVVAASAFESPAMLEAVAPLATLAQLEAR